MPQTFSSGCGLGHFDRQEHLGELYLSKTQISPGNLHTLGEQSTVQQKKYLIIRLLFAIIFVLLKLALVVFRILQGHVEKKRKLEILQFDETINDKHVLISRKQRNLEQLENGLAKQLRLHNKRLYLPIKHK